MGETALGLLVDRLAGTAPATPRLVRLQPALVVRESCVPLAQAAPRKRRRA